MEADANVLRIMERDKDLRVFEVADKGFGHELGTVVAYNALLRLSERVEGPSPHQRAAIGRTKLHESPLVQKSPERLFLEQMQSQDGDFFFGGVLKAWLPFHQ